MRELTCPFLAAAACGGGGGGVGGRLGPPVPSCCWRGWAWTLAWLVPWLHARLPPLFVALLCVLCVSRA